MNRGRQREVPVEVAPGVVVRVLEWVDPDGVIEAAIGDPSVDPYAAILWPAAVAAASELAGRVAPGERVLDLGAGTGLAALTAARLGAHAVALDHDEAALGRIAAAAAAQGLSVEFRRFDLHSAEPLPPADVVVLADVLYEAALARTAARRVAEAVARGARAVVGDPGRFSRAEFQRALEGFGLRAEFRDVPARLPGESRVATVGIAWIPEGAERASL